MLCITALVGGRQTIDEAPCHIPFMLLIARALADPDCSCPGCEFVVDGRGPAEASTRDDNASRGAM